MARRNSLSVEPLEGRDLMSASPLPVLLVIADGQDFSHREYTDTRAAVAGITRAHADAGDYSAIAFVGGWGASM